MRKWRPLVLVLMALYALFSPLASVVAACPANNVAAQFCASLSSTSEKKSGGFCPLCHMNSGGKCRACPQKSPQNGRVERIAATQWEAATDYRVLDNGCHCQIEPIKFVFSGRAQDALLAPDSSVFLPLRATNFPLPSSLRCAFLPFGHVPPPLLSALSRASRAPPRS